jgi:hypothetical protein
MDYNAQWPYQDGRKCECQLLTSYLCTIQATALATCHQVVAAYCDVYANNMYTADVLSADCNDSDIDIRENIGHLRCRDSRKDSHSTT